MAQRITSLKDPIVGACNDLFGMFGIDQKFMCELTESSLNSAEDINILLGLTHALKGNLVIGITKEAALKIVSGMMGGAEVLAIDDIAKSALCEFTNMLGGNALGKIGSTELIDITPPTIILGEKVFIMISRAPAKKLFFKMGDTKFSIAYCLD